MTATVQAEVLFHPLRGRNDILTALCPREYTLINIILIQKELNTIMSTMFTIR